MFVKPNAIIRDTRDQDAKDAELAETTSRNMLHIARQLRAEGSSLEAVLCAAAAAHLGHRIHPHAPANAEAA